MHAEDQLHPPEDAEEENPAVAGEVYHFTFESAGDEPPKETSFDASPQEAEGDGCGEGDPLADSFGGCP